MTACREKEEQEEKVKKGIIIYQRKRIEDTVVRLVQLFI